MGGALRVEKTLQNHLALVVDAIRVQRLYYQAILWFFLLLHS